MRRTRRPRTVLVAVISGLLLMISSCTTVINGTGSLKPIALNVTGFSGDTFDVQAKKALEDIVGFWTTAFPSIDHGKALPPLRGKLYSVDGNTVFATGRAPAAAASNKCLQRKLTFIVDNAAYCQLDDSIIWDRGANHLLPVLANSYGPALTALVFAHEFGHAIQHRLGTSKDVPIVDIESQADCAAGAFAANALAGKTPQVHITAVDLDRALVGYLQVRDSTPDSPADISHGNGFDRLNALQQGIRYGARYCYSASYLKDRTFTERGYVTDQDRLEGGNEPLADVVAKTGLVSDLNRFWTTTATATHKTFRPVTLTQAAHPSCTESGDSEFGYCPDDNTVYYSAAFAEQAYFSITALRVDPSTAAVTLVHNQPGDFALGMMIAIGWGLAARHQLAGGSTTDRAGLLAAICDAGSYAHDINRADYDATHTFILSPPDLDEATSAVLTLAGLDETFGARGTTGLERVQAVVTGYTNGLASC